MGLQKKRQRVKRTTSRDMLRVIPPHLPQREKIVTWSFKVGVYTYLCGHKEEGPGGVEEHALHAAVVLAEGVLRLLLRQLVNQDSGRDRCTAVKGATF